MEFSDICKHNAEVRILYIFGADTVNTQFTHLTDN